jgi:hypothetical protein
VRRDQGDPKISTATASPIALEALQRIAALFAIESSVNGHAPERRRAIFASMLTADEWNPTIPRRIKPPAYRCDHSRGDPRQESGSTLSRTIRPSDQPTPKIFVSRCWWRHRPERHFRGTLHPRSQHVDAASSLLLRSGAGKVP